MCITNRRPSFVSLDLTGTPLGFLRSDLSDVASLLEQHQHAKQHQGLIHSAPQKMLPLPHNNRGNVIFMTHHNHGAPTPKAADVESRPQPQRQPQPQPQPQPQLTLSHSLPEPVPSEPSAYVRGETKKQPPKKKPQQQSQPQQQPAIVNKKLLPGYTAKHHTRHYVQHNYHDHSFEEPDGWEEKELQAVAARQHQARGRGESHKSAGAAAAAKAAAAVGAGPNRGGVPVPFPLRLHEMLDKIEDDGYAGVISWQPHGRAFVVHDVKKFVSTVMPKYFRQTKITSFQRQLNLYGFSRITRGRDRGGYYHELFLRGRRFLANRMLRTKVKGTKIKAVSSPESEPNFYAFPPIGQRAAMAPPMPAPPAPGAARTTPPVVVTDAVASSDPNFQQNRPPKSKKVGGRDQSDLLLDFEGMTFHFLDPLAKKSPPNPNNRDQPFPQIPQSHSFEEEAPLPELSAASDADASLTPSSSTRSSFCDHGHGHEEMQPVSAAAEAASERMDDAAMDDFFSSFDVPLDDEGMNDGVDNDVDLGFLLEKIVD